MTKDATQWSLRWVSSAHVELMQRRWNVVDDEWGFWKDVGVLH